MSFNDLSDVPNTYDIFRYTPKSFNFTSQPLIQSGELCCSAEEGKETNEFDNLIKTNWNAAMKNGMFWYDMTGVKRKRLSGKIGFIAQLNTKRFTMRRKPECSSNVKEPFPFSKFNFMKIKDTEVLFEMKNSLDRQKTKNLVVINVSPIEERHILLVPNVEKCLPQVMNEDAIRLAIEVCLLSKGRSLRVGFNSLCAFASVNHLHFHAFYINQELPIDRVLVTEIGHGLFELKDYIIRGFALQMENRDVDKLSRQLHEISWYLSEENIPHNMFMSRHSPFPTDSDKPKTTEDIIRVFVFPKLPAEAMSNFAFNAAMLELGGFLPVRDETEYNELTEYKAIEILNYYTLKEDEFDELKHNLVLLLKRTVVG